MNNKIIPIKKTRPTVQVTQEDQDSVAASVLFEKEAAKGLDDDEALFNVEATIAKQVGDLFDWELAFWCSYKCIWLSSSALIKSTVFLLICLDVHVAR